MKLRDYQKKQFNASKKFLASKKVQRGQVYSPTGSGKTVVFMKVISAAKKAMGIADRPLRICIAHPRLALSQEQLGRFKSEFGAEFVTTSFHSGTHLRGEEVYREFSLTCRNKLEEIITKSGDHATFTSYHSFHKIADIDFDLLICDEAHNLVPSDSDENRIAPKIDTIKAIKAKKVLFFTATPINDDAEECQGMNNADMFGEIICEEPPRPLIEKGYIVGPMIQTIDVKTDQSGEGVDTTQIVAESFKAQKKALDKHGIPGIQMLVCSRGYKDHRKIEEEQKELWKLIGKVDVFVVEAKESRLNGQRLNSRIEALELITERGRLGHDTIVIHYDTLAEGIDISTLTGVCLLRKMKKSKILQTIGRCGRVHYMDQDKDINDRVKPYSILTIPVVDGTHIGGIETSTFAEAFTIGGYGDLIEYRYRDGSEDPQGNTKKDDDEWSDEEEVDPFFSNVIELHALQHVRHLEDIGLTF